MRKEAVAKFELSQAYKPFERERKRWRPSFEVDNEPVKDFENITGADIAEVLFQCTVLELLQEKNKISSTLINATFGPDLNIYGEVLLPFLEHFLALIGSRSYKSHFPAGKISELQSWAELVLCILNSYLSRYVQPEPPSATLTWTRNQVRCGKNCVDCQSLNAFLADPQRTVGRFPLGKMRRLHIHQQLEAYCPSCTHMTERVGNPQTLVVTKTNTQAQMAHQAWQKRRSEAERNIKNLRPQGTLEEILGPDRYRQILQDVSSGKITVSAAREPLSCTQPNATIDPATRLGRGAGIKRGATAMENAEVEVIDLTDC